MKDPIVIWRKFLRRQYSAVSTNNPTASDDSPGTSRRNSNGSRTDERRKTSYSFGLVGLVAIAVGMLMMFTNPYDMIFKWKILFTEGGEVFDMWRNPPVDLYLRVYLFNITNPDEFLSGKEKLKLKEVGPYVYRELLTHDNITFNNNGTLTTNPSHPLVWVPELSGGDHENDQLVLPHIALLSITHVVADSSIFTRLGMNLVIRQTNSKPIVTMTPKEFMFGYQSALMTLGNKFLPSWISFDKLGLIDRMYNFKGDYETVYTGEHDITKAGLLDTYQGSTHMPQWEGYCGNINEASDGTKFRSQIQPNDTLKFFRKSMCRAKPLVRVNSTISSGLSGYVYRFPENVNDNGLYTPENACFCKTKKCFPVGLLDVHDCYYGFPIALSYPHFLDADPKLLDSIDGLKPDRRKHETYFVIQPESGLPLDLAVRYQINMVMGDVRNMANVERFSNMVIPMLWTENRLYSLPEKLSTKFYMYLNVLPTVTNGIMYLTFFLGAAFIALALHRFRKSHRRSSEPVTWIDEEVATNMERKISVYMPTTRDRMTSKDLEVYFNSLVAPLNQQIDCGEYSFHEFQNLKDQGDVSD